MSKIASIYSTDAIFSCQVEKKYDIFINADVLPKCPKIGWTVGSLLNRKYLCYVLTYVTYVIDAIILLVWYEIRSKIIGHSLIIKTN